MNIIVVKCYYTFRSSFIDLGQSLESYLSHVIDKNHI